MKPSYYNLYLEDGSGNLILYNTRSDSVLFLTKEGHQQYLDAIEKGRMLEDFSKIELLMVLIEKGFIVDDETNELEAIVKQHYEMSRGSSVLQLTVTPTMACNLSCTYCFEQNKYGGLMSQKIQDSLVMFIENQLKKGVKAVLITWYGGEPLLGLEVIKNLSERIISLCEKYHAIYSASIVTNGILLNEQVIAILKSCRITLMQITLDGPPFTHDKRRIYPDGSPSFQTIIKAVKLVAGEFDLMLRINADVEIAQHLEELLQILKNEGLSNSIRIYLAPIHTTHDFIPAATRTCYPYDTWSYQAMQGCSSRSSEGCVTLFDARKFSAVEIEFDQMLERFGFKRHLQIRKPRHHTCIADLDSGLLIEANGAIQKCWELAGNQSAAVGFLWRGGIIFNHNIEKWHNWSVFKDEVCKRCVFLPVCMGYCPLQHMVNNPDHCPTYKYNWDKIINEVATRVLKKTSDFSRRGPIKLISDRLKVIRTSDLLDTHYMIIFEVSRSLKPQRKGNLCLTIKEELYDSKIYYSFYSNGKKMILNHTGYDVWQLLDGTRNLEEIITYMMRRYGIIDEDKKLLIRDVIDFMKQLELNGLIDTKLVQQKIKPFYIDLSDQGSSASFDPMDPNNLLKIECK